MSANGHVHLHLPGIHDLLKTELLSRKEPPLSLILVSEVLRRLPPTLGSII